MSSRDVLDLAWIVPVLPLVGAGLLLVLGKRIGERWAGWIASALLGLSFAWSVAVLLALRDLPGEARVHVTDLYTWMPAGGLNVKMGFLLDPLSVTWMLLVSGVGTLIHVYSVGYMHGDPRAPRFFAYLNLFAASMLVLVMGSSLLVTFLGWEGVGLCSYLLISFWFERNAAAVAGKKAFVTNRVGDVGFMLAMFLMFASAGTLSYGAMGATARTASGATVTAIALLLLLAAAGKSAQIPLHLWLPDAMEGPTPVSALIHAATMVTAGVFVLCRAHPFLEASSSASTTVAWIGAATALLAGTVAIVQPDIKRVLAYSTVSQLGFMFLAVGEGAYTAAVFMVVAHAFYKGALFLGAGSVIHGNDGKQDMRVMGGFRRFMPVTAFAMVIAWLGIVGVPPLAGFWAKDEVLSDTFFRHDYALYGVGLLAAVFTGFYMTRLVWITFFGNERWEAEVVEAAEAATAGVAAAEEGPPELAPTAVAAAPEGDPTPTVAFGDPPEPPSLHHPPHEAPALMGLPVLTLALLALVGGLLNLPFRSLEFLGHWLEPSFVGVDGVEIPSFAKGAGVEALSAVFALVGLGIAYALYRRGLPAPDEDPVLDRLGAAGPVLGHAYHYDETVARAVDGPVRAGASWLDRVFDQRVVDGAVDGIGRLVLLTAAGLRRVQDGLVRRYALTMALGAGALLLFFLLWAGR